MHLPLQSYGFLIGLILSLGFMGLYTLATWLVLKKLRFSITPLESMAISVVVSILVSSWISFGSWYIFGPAGGTILTSGIPVIILLWQSSALVKAYARLQAALRRASKHPIALSMPQTLFWSSLGLMFVWLAYNHFLQPTEIGWTSAGNTWADLALHMSLASHFVVNGVHSLMLPVLPSVKLTYPFLVDLHSAQLYMVGHSWQLAFGIPSVTLIASSSYLLYRIGYRLTGSKRTGAIWLLLVLFAGSAAGVIPLLRGLLLGTVDMTKDYSHLSVSNVLSQEHFANFITSHLYPQRSYLLGFGLSTATLLVLTTLLQAKRADSKQWIGLGVLVGLMPFAHIHSFMVIGGILGLLALHLTLQKSPHTPKIWLAIVVSFLIAAPQLTWQFSGSFHTGFSYWHFGWLTPPEGNFFIFWWINWGLLLILIPTSIWLIRQRLQSPLGWVLLLEGGMILLACNLYIFQPNAWDNMKFITYAYIWLTLPVAWLLAKATAQSWIEKIAATVTLLIIVSPGIQSVVMEGTQSYPFLTPDDMAVANYVSTQLPADQTILTSDRHNNPIPTLTGRPIVMGYRGWLSSYGIDYTPTEDAIRDIWEGGEGSQTQLAKLKVRYIALSEAEAREIGIDPATLSQRYQEIYASNGWHIWDVSSQLTE